MAEIPDAELAALRAATKAGERAQALYDGLKVEYDKLKPLETRVPELEAQVKTFQAEKLDATFAAAGVTNPSIRRIFDLEYQELSVEAGKEKPPLADWLAGLRALPADKRPAHLAPFLTGQGTQANNQTGTQTRTPAGLPDTSKGAQQVQGAGSQFSAEQVKNMSPAEFRANREAILAANNISAPPLPNAPTAAKA